SSSPWPRPTIRPKSSACCWNTEGVAPQGKGGLRAALFLDGPEIPRLGPDPAEAGFEGDRVHLTAQRRGNIGDHRVGREIVVDPHLLHFPCEVRPAREGAHRLGEVPVLD